VHYISLGAQPKRTTESVDTAISQTIWQNKTTIHVDKDPTHITYEPNTKHDNIRSIVFDSDQITPNITELIIITTISKWSLNK